MAAALSVGMARSGKRVLVIDADLHHPDLHNTLGVNNKTGLADILAGNLNARDAIQRTSHANVSVLPAGIIDRKSNAGVDAGTLALLLAELSLHYDQIVVDSPSLGSDPDAAEIAAACDASLLVVRPGVSTEPAGSSAVEQLLAVGANVLGVVANGVSRRDQVKAVWRCCYARRPVREHGAAGGQGLRFDRQVPPSVAA